MCIRDSNCRGAPNSAGQHWPGTAGRQPREPHARRLPCCNLGVVPPTAFGRIQHKCCLERQLVGWVTTESGAWWTASLMVSMQGDGSDCDSELCVHD
eukprot:12728220-Alexandrium_andersonii.AAC.1